VTIANGYTTLSAVKTAARMGTAVSADDAMIEMSIETASRMIDGYTGRRFWTNGTETRQYATQDYYELPVDDIAGTAITLKTSSDVNGTYDITWAASDFTTQPLNGVASGVAAPITLLRASGDYMFTVTEEPSAQVTAVFGYGTAVPTEIAHACIILSLRQFKRYGSPEGVLSYGDFAVRVGSRMDPDVGMILAPFRRDVVGNA
jgi:hypothetical protein